MGKARLALAAFVIAVAGVSVFTIRAAHADEPECPSWAQGSCFLPGDSHVDPFGPSQELGTMDARDIVHEQVREDIAKYEYSMYGQGLTPKGNTSTMFD